MPEETLEILPVIGFALIFSLMAIFRGREIIRTGDQPFTDKKIRDEDRQLVGYSLVASGIILFIAVLGYLMPNPAVNGFICLIPISLLMFFVPVYVGTYLRGED